MEVLFGPPSFSIEAPPPAPYSAASLSPDNPSADAATHNPSGSGLRESRSGSSIGENSSASSSSIGVPDDDSEDDDEVQSKSKEEGGLCGLDSLEDALPIKRGLSSHFSGKSKSFASLSDAIEVKDLEKPENAFNKRRRILMASKWSRRGSFYNWPNPKSMPLLALNEDEDEEEEEEEEEAQPEPGEGSDSEDEVKDRRRRSLGQRFHDRKNGFKSMSCFDLQDYEHQ